MLTRCVKCGRVMQVMDSIPHPMDGYVCSKCGGHVIGGKRYSLAELIDQLPEKPEPKICPHCNGSGVVEDEG